MILEKIITRERIKTEISDTDKWTLIEDLADMIAASSRNSDREVLIQDTLEREEKGSTGIGKGIAIPHARTTGVTDLVGALGISRQGIDFDAEDGEPCHLIFLILAPPAESTRYLKALSAVANIGRDENLMSRLTSASSPDEVISVLGEVEGANQH
jgi:mannitol/fructose-specific phosphotransferase system IIA component (Ntr-type)